MLILMHAPDWVINTWAADSIHEREKSKKHRISRWGETIYGLGKKFTDELKPFICKQKISCDRMLHISRLQYILAEKASLDMMMPVSQI